MILLEVPIRKKIKLFESMFTMKTVKRLPKFSIIYMHNPYKCVNCMESEQCYDGFGDCDEEEILMKNSNIAVTKTIKPRTLVFVKKSSLINRHCSKMNQKCTFRTRSRLNKKKTKKPSEKVKIEKISCVLSVINTKRSKLTNNPSGKKKCVKSRMMKTTHDSSKKQKCDKKDTKKAPGKGTLKRKRWIFGQLNTSDENYEDDIFENEKFENFQDLIEDETDCTEKYDHIKTPEFPFSVSPREKSPSPIYKDCYSPTELTESRKGAEEYRFRRGKMRREPNIVKRNGKKQMPENKPDVQKTLEAVVEILNKTQKMLDKSESDSEEDTYFSDLFEPSSSQSCS